MAKRPRSFSQWFDQSFRRRGESRAQAIARFQTEAGLGFSTIYYALRGARLSANCAQRVEEFTNGEVLAVSLILGPTRREVKANTEVA